MATSANAAAILQFQQQNPSLTPIVATNPTTTTTRLATTGTGATGAIPPGWIPVFVTLGAAPVSQPAFMSFTVTPTSGGPATVAGTTVSQDSYTGTIVFSRTASAPASPSDPANILTVQFTGGLLTGVAGGNSANFSASAPPNTVTYTSGEPTILALLASTNANNFALALSGLTSALTVTNGTVAPFNASISGTFSSTAIPEPTSLVMASIPALLGLGFVGFRRRSMAS
jgi:hypothetical protein